MTETMNYQQITIYYSFLKLIDTTLEETIANINNSSLSKVNDTYKNNVEIWKKIQVDLFKSGLPRERMIELSLYCDDVFRIYDKKVSEILDPNNF